MKTSYKPLHPKFPQKWTLGLEFRKILLWIRNWLFQDTMCANFQAKRTILTFLAEISRSEFQNLSSDSELVHSRYHIFQFLDKTNNFQIFGLNLGKLPNYVQYFRSNSIEGVADS